MGAAMAVEVACGLAPVGTRNLVILEPKCQWDDGNLAGKFVRFLGDSGSKAIFRNNRKLSELHVSRCHFCHETTLES